MKLQAQYNRVTIISSLFILLIAATGYYFLLRYVLVNQLDESLKVEEAEIQDYVKIHDKLPAPTVYKDQRISFQTVDKPGKRNFKSIGVYDTAENETASGRILFFPVKLHDQDYIVSVSKSEEETQSMVWIILFSTIALIVLLVAILFFTNRFLLRKLWQPFRTTLSSIKEFNLAAPADIKMQPTHITEFRELNESIRMMSKKVLKDYQSLKDFTDHASHEMQTPLAIINSKLDILIQEPELSGKSLEQVQGIYKAVEKLSRMCRSLLLLARIENNQYTDIQQVSMDGLIVEKNNELKEWISAMELKTDLQLQPLKVMMNKELAEIMASNLFRNAVRHTEAEGTIIIQTKDHLLSVSNTGRSALDKNRVFDRFYKSDHSDGSGLGLAIVQHICEQYQFRLDYDFIDGMHSFRISFL